MEKIKEIVKKLNDIDEEWFLVFTKEKGNINERANIVPVLNELIKEVREICKESSEEKEQLLRKLVCDEEAYNNIIGFAKFTLVEYFTMAHFREIEEENIMKARHLLIDIFRNSIVRFDDSFVQKYEEYSFESKEDFVEVLDVLDSLTDYYIKHHYTRNAIEREFKDDTGLNDELCRCYAQLYEENYNQIQMNVLLDMLGEQKKSLERLDTAE